MDNLLVLWQAPTLTLQLLIDGVLVGAIYCLPAYGMALVWGVMKIINVAQGDFVMLGGYVALYVSYAGIHPMFGVPVAAAVLFVFGWIVYQLVIRHIVDRDLFVSVLATFGISIVLQQLANQLFSANVETAEANLGSTYLFGSTIVVGNIKLVAVAIALVLAVVLFLFLKHSRLGQAIRATAQNPRAARILGIETSQVFAMTYALNAAICGAAGALVVQIWIIHPYIGLTYTIRAFMIVVVAGLGNIAGVVLAGLGLGAAEQFASFLLGAEYQAAFVFSLLVVILLWRSQMLARRRLYLK
ncbi:MAG: branched-chain amino acid transporter permease [Rhodospirillales bacterium]|jgi:branched-chain amino acid transport system permease protein|nr:branched-chain amino acid transporter permease [Rhodospirillales bacterium]